MLIEFELGILEYVIIGMMFSAWSIFMYRLGKKVNTYKKKVKRF